jgi:uncharacterized protein involved in cysteine biosynthesis
MIRSTEHPRSFVSEFLFGLSMPLSVLKLLLARPKLMLLCLLPILIAGATTIGLFFTAAQWIGQAVPTVIASLGWGVEGWLAPLVSILINLGLIIASGFALFLLAGLLAGPLLDTISEAAEPHVTPPLSKDEHKVKFFRAIWIDALKSVFFAATSVVLFLADFIPGIALLAVPLGFLVTAATFTSFAHTRRGEGIKDAIELIRRTVGLHLGFGLSIWILLPIPFISAALLPIAAIGGTWIYARAKSLTRQTFPS